MPERIAHALAEQFIAFKNQEEQLRDELARYKAVLDVAPCPMVLTDKVGNIIYANASYCSMLGVRLEEVAANGWKKFVVPSDLERISALWEKVITEKLPIFEEWLLMKRVGRVFWRSRRLEDGSFAVAIFHPACAFFSTNGSCSLSECKLSVTGST